MTYSEEKMRRLRSLISEDLKTLTDPNSSDEERMEALKNREATRRQRAGQHNRQPVDNLLDPRPSVEDEMNAPAPAEKHGYAVDPNGYQEFTTSEVHTTPRATMNTYNQTQRGFRESVEPSKMIAEQMSRSDRDFVGTCVSALRRQASEQGLRPEVVCERFIRSNSNLSDEQGYLIAHGMGMVQESYSDSAGKYVVVMPTWMKQLADLGKPQPKSALRHDQERRMKNAVTKNAAPAEKMKELPPAQAPNLDVLPAPGAPAVDAKLEAYEQEWDRLVAILESAEDHETKRQTRNKMNHLRNLLVSLKAREDKKDEDAKRREEEKKADRPNRYARALDKKSHDDKVKEDFYREEANQQRHLSLLEQCQQVMSKGKYSSSGWS
jgi:hypothetical protein